MRKAEKYVPKYAKAPAVSGQRGRDAFYIFLCYFTGLVTGFEFGGYQYIFLDVRMEFGFSNTMMATVNVVQTVVSLCVSLVLSALLDRLNKRKLLYTGAALYSVGTALMLAAGDAFWFFGFKLLQGVAGGMLQAGIFPAMTLIAPEKSAKHTSMEQVFCGGGSVLAPVILSFLLGSQLNLHWKMHYMIVLAGGIFLMVGFFCSKPSITRYQPEQAEEKKSAPLRSALLTLPFLLVLFSSALYMNMETGLMNYAREFFEVSGAGAQAGLCISLIWGAMVVSRFLGSHIKQKGLLVVGSFCGAGACIALMILMPSPQLLPVWAVLMGFFAGPGWPTILGIGLETYPQYAGMLSSANMMFTSIGSMIGAFAVGAASDQLGMQTAMWAAVLFAAVGAAVGGGAAVWAARRRKKAQA